VAADLGEKVGRYQDLFQRALDSARLAPNLAPDLRARGEDFLSMARAYFADGLHFRQEDDPVNALVCFCYGHAWLDAGLRLGLLDGGAAP